MAKSKKRTLNPAKRYKNPAASLERSGIELLMGSAGTLAITMAVNRCTLQEKMLISAMIPSLIKLIRSVSKAEREEVLIRLWPPDDPSALHSTDQTPTDQPEQ
jgi:hypothetical protein